MKYIGEIKSIYFQGKKPHTFIYFFYDLLIYKGISYFYVLSFIISILIKINLSIIEVDYK